MSVNTNQRPPTLGEQRIRTWVELGQNSAVDELKQLSAKLIDLCEELKEKDPRLCAMAQSHYELAAMLAVKLATA